MTSSLFTTFIIFSLFITYTESRYRKYAATDSEQTFKRNQFCDSCERIVGEVFNQIPKLANFTILQMRNGVEKFCDTRLNKFEPVRDLCHRINGDMIEPFYNYIVTKVDQDAPKKWCNFVKLCKPSET